MNIDIEDIIQKDLQNRVYKSRRERYLREYYSNPNYCKWCNSIIIMRSDEGPADVRDKSFCSIECSKKYKHEHPEINIPKKFLDNNRITLCLNCKKEISNRNKYCSVNCRNEYRQKEFEEKWLSGEISGNNNSAWTDVSERVRKYLFRIYDNKCARCGWGEINPYTGKIPLEIEHIDGNAENTTPDNVILLCPNCHSLTATYRGANKGNGRPRTWIPKVIDVEI